MNVSVSLGDSLGIEDSRIDGAWLGPVVGVSVTIKLLGDEEDGINEVDASVPNQR